MLAKQMDLHTIVICLFYSMVHSGCVEAMHWAGQGCDVGCTVGLPTGKLVREQHETGPREQSMLHLTTKDSAETEDTPQRQLRHRHQSSLLTCKETQPGGGGTQQHVNTELNPPHHLYMMYPGAYLLTLITFTRCSKYFHVNAVKQIASHSYSVQ